MTVFTVRDKDEIGFAMEREIAYLREQLTLLKQRAGRCGEVMNG